MSIFVDSKRNVFHLQTPTSSYVMRVERDRYLAHVGWFARVAEWRGSNDLIGVDRGFSPNPDYDDRTFSLDTFPQEYPSAGRGDFRSPAIEVSFEDGTTALDLWYEGYRVLAGKPALSGLPATYCERVDEVDTLEIDLRDPVSGLLVTLSYSVWRDRDAISRSVRATNGGSAPITIRKILSVSLDFADSSYSLLHLSGAHCREREAWFRPLAPGSQGVESRRGASSGQQNPFIVLVAREADGVSRAGETSGEVFGFSLVYSGNFVAAVEVDPFDCARVSMGLSPVNFSWILKSGETFQAPEVAMVRSGSGLGAMSRTYHDLYRERLCRGSFRDRVRPVLVNNWEATYFNFDEKKLLALAAKAKEADLDLFVLDDGWFGARDDDKTSLGDWYVDRRKLPGGLASLADGVRSLGLDFGLWVEPEMISERSELYRDHPDWALRAPGREPVRGRDQLVLDLSRVDVQEYLIGVLKAAFFEAKVAYVKWDMNRHIVETFSALARPETQGEISHRYMLGLYRVLEEVTASFPNVLFESCSGGGGRFDPGMLYYMPQTWTSDNTDAIARVAIQAGTSLAYPASSMACHVSAVPNHQLGRVTSLATRGNVAMAGAFGYELDLTKLTDDEIAEIRGQVARYKSIRETVLFGDLYRLRDPWDDQKFSAWMNVSKDRRSAVVTLAWTFPQPNPSVMRLRLAGLDPALSYEMEGEGKAFLGDELMNAGLRLRQGDARNDTVQIVLRAR